MGACGKIHLLCAIWSWDRERIMSSFILSHETYCLSPSFIHTYSTKVHEHSWRAANKHTQTPPKGHTLLPQKSHSTNALIARSMPAAACKWSRKPIGGWVRLSACTLTHATDRSAHCAKTPGLNRSVCRLHLEPLSWPLEQNCREIQSKKSLRKF